MKPILFNTEMVRAILEGRKTVTRRVIKPQPKGRIAYACMGHKHGTWGYPGKDAWKYWGEEFRLPETLTEEEAHMRWTPPFRADDILYVRETWCQYGELNDNDRLIDGTEKYYYRADGENPTPFDYFLVQHPGWDEHRETPVWKPSIHMPKEAARLFLRVTEVRAERLQDIEDVGVSAEGLQIGCYFDDLWNNTIKKSDLPIYGWDANPWVWVIEFERCEKPEED